MKVKELMDELAKHPSDAEVDVDCFDCGPLAIETVECDADGVTINTGE
ncbi:hypothetical protein LCGC14_0143260 [marine sediment metagenome]|uniref:Uncharacterized protein n=1 Tax=marine sediment metagenome TaxID=412755 RepID=A0A0F9Y2X7_9ZZZZ